MIKSVQSNFCVVNSNQDNSNTNSSVTVNEPDTNKFAAILMAKNPVKYTCYMRQRKVSYHDVYNMVVIIYLDSIGIQIVAKFKLRQVITYLATFHFISILW